MGQGPSCEQQKIEFTKINQCSDELGGTFTLFGNCGDSSDCAKVSENEWVFSSDNISNTCCEGKTKINTSNFLNMYLKNQCLLIFFNL